MKPSTSSLLIAAVLGSVSLSACATDSATGGEEEDLDVSLDDGKADGVIRYKLAMSNYGELNQGLDEWVTGGIRMTQLADGRWEAFAPRYFITPDTSAPTWWRLDIRPGQEGKRVGFYVLWRAGEDESWRLLAPEVTRDDGTVDRTGLFNSFKMGRGTLEVGSPRYAGTATSDFFWNDIEPEFAFAPVVWGTFAELPGVATFEISVTDEE